MLKHTSKRVRPIAVFPDIELIGFQATQHLLNNVYVISQNVVALGGSVVLSCLSSSVHEEISRAMGVLHRNVYRPD